MRWADLAPARRTLGVVLRDQAHHVGDDLFLVDATQRLTYSQANERVNRCANGLKSLGVEPGDRVLLLMA
ncbi:MAG: AMP-binding protein, partial [Acidimicrobiia bacterium]